MPHSVLISTGRTTSVLQQTSAFIGFYPGTARGAWKHAPIILLPRRTALLRALPPKFQRNQSVPMQLVLLNIQQW